MTNINHLFEVLLTLEKSERDVIIESLDPISSSKLFEISVDTERIFTKKNDPLRTGNPVWGTLTQKVSDLSIAARKPGVKKFLDSKEYKRYVNQDSLKYGKRMAAGGAALGAGAAATHWFVERLNLHREYKKCKNSECKERVMNKIKELRKTARNNGIKLTLAGAMVGVGLGAGRRGKHAYDEFQTRKKYGLLADKFPKMKKEVDMESEETKK